MNKIAANLISGRNLKKAYDELADVLAKHERVAEQCYTYESICRLLKREKDLNIYNDKVIKANLSYCTNSFDAYRMKNTPISHEFPIEKSKTANDILLSYVDRYIGIVHLLLTIFNYDEFIQIAKLSKKLKDKIYYMIRYVDKSLAEHIRGGIEGEEKTLGELIAIDIPTNIELLLLSVEFGNNNSETFVKILNYYLVNKQDKKAIDFYNEYYAIVFNEPPIYTKKDLITFFEEKSAKK